MRVDINSKEELDGYFERLDAWITPSGGGAFVKYLELGTHTVRVLSYSPLYEPILEAYFESVIKEHAPQYDATIICWHETDVAGLAGCLDERLDPRKNLRLRVERLAQGYRPPVLLVHDVGFSPKQPLVKVDAVRKKVMAWRPALRTAYFAVGELSLQGIIRHGRLFLEALGLIVKSRTTSLAHAAVVGLDGKGILLCGRGLQGKSTMSVRALLDGFDYVGEDVLILDKEQDALYAWPVYSMILLSPKMHDKMYSDLRPNFLAMNANGTKYVLSIARWYDRFARRYPIDICMLPQKVGAPEPSITLCTKAEKGMAITKLVHSSLRSLGNMHDTATVKNLVRFIRGYPFFKINLSEDIDKNQRCLREFMTARLHG